MMWSWKDKITPAELVEHIDMLLTLLPSELKEVLKTRDLPVSGTKEDLQKRLLNYDVFNMVYPKSLGEQFWKNIAKSPLGELPILQIREMLVDTMFPTLNWTSFPEVLLDE